MHGMRLILLTERHEGRLRACVELLGSDAGVRTLLKICCAPPGDDDGGSVCEECADLRLPTRFAEPFREQLKQNASDCGGKRCGRGDLRSGMSGRKII
jgi:hypothetical protein